MKVILQQAIPGVGKKNDIVTVADGYARNYLMPRGLAVEATPGRCKHLETLKSSEARRDERARDMAEKVAQRLRETPLVITARTGRDGKLYGSVTAQDIAKRLKDEFKIEVDRRRIGLPEPIRSLGVHTVPVSLLSNLHVDLTVEVVSET